MDFTFNSFPYRVIFAHGALNRVADEAALIGKRALILSTPEQASAGRNVFALLGPLAGGLFDRATMHVPVSIVEEALIAAKEIGADFTVAIGGGSTTGLAKALSLRAGLPSLVIPTTYAGSEVTPIWGMTEDGIKTTGRDAGVVPRTVIYDPDLTRSLPLGMTVASGLNAIAHCMEGLYAVDGNPIVSMMAEEGIRSLYESLPRLAEDGGDDEARTQALYGCWLAGMVLGSASVALHHKLCHTLGGRFDMPHAETHTAILPHAIAYNAPAAPDAMVRASRAMGGREPPAALYELASKLGAEMSLAKLGMPEEGIEIAAKLAIQNPYPNPRPVTEDGIRALLARAYTGAMPQSAELEPA